MPNNLTITVTAAEVGGRCVVFKEDADLSEYDPSKFKTWVFESAPDNAGANLRTLSKITAKPDSAAYPLDYTLCFAETHCVALTGPDGNRKENPVRSDFEALNARVLGVYVARADTSRGLTDDDFLELKRPAPTPEGANA